MGETMKEFLNVYQGLSEEEKAQFTPEQRRVIEMQISFKKLFDDPMFYKTVQQAICEAIYEQAQAK